MAAPIPTTLSEAEKDPVASGPEPAPKKKGRTNTPWTAEEEQRLKMMRDAGRSWGEIAKVRLYFLQLQVSTDVDQTFPTRTEGSVKKHWYKVSLIIASPVVILILIGHALRRVR